MSRRFVPVIALLVALSALPFPSTAAQEGSEAIVDRTDLMDGFPESSGEPVLFARFIQSSDAQLIDDDFPWRPEALDPVDPPFGKAQRPQEEYVDEALNVFIQEINALHARTPLDFVINTGDAVDNALENEIQRFLDNLYGTYTTEGPLTGRAWKPDGQSENVDDDSNDVTDAATSLPEVFLEEGYNVPLDEDVPFYFALGNHDTMVNGNVPRQPGFNEIAADSGRYFVTEPEFVSMMFRSDPCSGDFDAAADAGHGFAFAGDRLCDANPDNHGYYSFDKGFAHFIVLNTVNDEWHETNEHSSSTLDPVANAGGPTVGGYAQGAIDIDQFRWLVKDLDANKDKPVILFAHHSPNTIVVPDGAAAFGFRDGQTLVDTLSEYANVVAFVGAHTHKHKIEPLGSFWNIETASLIDAPHENRLIELYVAPNGTGFIETRPVYAGYDRLEAFAKQDAQGDPDAGGEPKDRAARLWFPVPESVLASIRATLNDDVEINVARTSGDAVVDTPITFTATVKGGFDATLPEGTEVTWIITGEGDSVSGPLALENGVGTFTQTFMKGGLYNVTVAASGPNMEDRWERMWLSVRDPAAEAEEDAKAKADEALKAANEQGASTNSTPPAPVVAVLAGLGAAAALAGRRRALR